MRAFLPGQMRRVVLGVTAGVVGLGCAAWGQSFSQPTVIPTGNWPLAVYTADFNGDGIPDLAYIAPSTYGVPSTLHVLLNDGKGNFTQSATVIVGTSVVALGDLTGNGHVDVGLVVGQYNDPSDPVSIEVFPGNGNGTFKTDGSTYATLNIPSLAPYHFNYVYAARLEATGPLDLIAEDATNNVMFTFHATSPTFSTVINTFTPIGYVAHTGIALPDGTGPVAVADLNGDGNNELIVNGQTGYTAQIFTGSATGIGAGASPATRFAGIAPNGLQAIHSMVVQDYANSGHPGLIAETANGHIWFYDGDGAGSFNGGLSNLGGDWDGRTGNGGHLVFANNASQGGLIATATPAGISKPIGIQITTVNPEPIYNAGPGHTSYAVADFNQDGIPDIAVDSPEGIAILYGNPDGSFQTSLSFAAGQPAMSGALGVFTSSGNLDAVVSTAATQAQFLRGNGDGTFTFLGYGSNSPTPIPTTTETGTAGLWSMVQTGDFSGDGLLDIALTADGSLANLPTRGTGIYTQLGNGDGTFAATAHVPVSQTSTCNGLAYLLFGRSVVADFNADGFPDMADRDPYEQQIDLGDAGYPLREQEEIGDAACVVHSHDLIVTGDFNNDGLPDLIVQTDGHLNLELNQGAAAFSQPEPLGGFTFDATQDLSLDGSLTTPGQLTAPTLSSTFGGMSTTLGFPAFPGSAAVADLDGDGNQDLIVAYANLSANLQAPTSAAPNYLYIWFGSGGGKFLTSAKHRVNPVRLTPSRNFYQVAVADMNGDGIPDLILSDGYILSVQHGKGDGTFGAETHYLAGQGINSISVGDVNGDGKPDLVLANGGAVLTNPVANLEVLGTNPDVNTGGITVLLNHANVTLPVPTGTLAASPEPSTYGSAFSISATMNAVGAGATPTGTVTFSLGTTLIGPANLVSGVATVAVPASVYATLALGTYGLSAAYSGDANYSPAALTGSHTVGLIPTSMSLLLCVDPPGSQFPCGNPIESTPLISPITMYYGQSLDGVGIESATDLTGTITFYSGSRVFCTLNANLQSGSMTCPPTSGIFPAGTTTVTVVYSGDSVHEPSTSNGIVVTVYPDPTTATVTSSLNPATVGQAVTFTANVLGNFAIPQGQPVSFLDGTTVMNTGTLDATGSATFTTSALAVGTHPITVVLPGSQNFNSITSKVLSEVIAPATTAVGSAVSLISSIDPSAPGQPVTFSATVTVPGPFAIAPSGTVTFLDGTTALGTQTLNAAGIATLTTATLASGSHAMTASYGGTAVGISPILTSVSLVLTQVVTTAIGTEAPGFALTVTPVPVTLGVGDTAVLQVNVRDTSGFNQPVQLACSGLPVEAACTFVQGTIPAGGGSTTLYLSVAAPRNCGSNTPYFVGSLGGGAGRMVAFAMPGLALMLAGVRWRWRKRANLLGGAMVLIGLGAMAAISGCGNCTDLGTRPGDYSFSVTGTAGSTVESQKIGLTVTIP